MGDPSPVQKRLCNPLDPRGRADILALVFESPLTLWSVEEGGRFCVWTAQKDPLGPNYTLSPSPRQQTDLDNPAMLWALEPAWKMGFSACDELTAYQLPSGTPLWSRTCPSWITAMALGHGSLPGQPGKLVTGHDDGSLLLWDLAAGNKKVKRLTAKTTGPVVALAISPDGSLFAVAGEDRTILVLGPDGACQTLCQPNQASSHKGPITGLCWGGEKGQTLFSSSWDQTVRVWDFATNQPRILLNSHIGQVTAMTCLGRPTLPSQNDSTAAAGFISADDSGHLHPWDTHHWELLGVPRELEAPAKILAPSPDGNLLAWADSARRIHIIPIRDLDLAPKTLDSTDPRWLRDDLFLDPQTLQLIHRPVDGNVRFWQIQSQGDGTSPTPPCTALVCTLDGEWIWLSEQTAPPARGSRILGFQRSLFGQWGLASVFEATVEQITSLALSDDGKALAIASHFGPEVEIRSLPEGIPKWVWGSDWRCETVQSLVGADNGEWIIGTIDPMATGFGPGHTWQTGPDGAKALDAVPSRVLVRKKSTNQIARIDHLGQLGILVQGSFTTPPECDGPWQAIAFSPTSQHLALGGKKQISLYDLDRKKWVGSVETTAGVRALVMDGSPSAIWAALCSNECCLVSMSSWVGSDLSPNRGVL